MLPSDLGPSQTGHQADFALLVHFGVAEPRHTQKLMDVRFRNLFLMLGAALDHAPRHFAADIANLALQITHAGFPRVVADDFQNRAVFEDDVLFAEPRLLTLLLHQVLAGNLQLFLLGVALEPQNFHAVLQGGGIVCMTLAVATNSTCDKS